MNNFLKISLLTLIALCMPLSMQSMSKTYQPLTRSSFIAPAFACIGTIAGIRIWEQHNHKLNNKLTQKLIAIPPKQTLIRPKFAPHPPKKETQEKVCYLEKFNLLETETLKLSQYNEYSTQFNKDKVYIGIILMDFPGFVSKLPEIEQEAIERSYGYTSHRTCENYLREINTHLRSSGQAFCSPLKELTSNLYKEAQSLNENYRKNLNLIIKEKEKQEQERIIKEHQQEQRRIDDEHQKEQKHIDEEHKKIIYATNEKNNSIKAQQKNLNKKRLYGRILGGGALVSSLIWLGITLKNFSKVKA
jgi:hypothetical protein